MLSGPVDVTSASPGGPTNADGATYILSIIPGKSLRDEHFYPGRVRPSPIPSPANRKDNAPMTSSRLADLMGPHRRPWTVGLAAVAFSAVAVLATACGGGGSGGSGSANAVAHLGATTTTTSQTSAPALQRAPAPALQAAPPPLGVVGPTPRRSVPTL